MKGRLGGMQDVRTSFVTSLVRTQATAEGWGYPHFKKNKGLLDSIGIEEKNRYWSLVCDS